MKANGHADRFAKLGARAHGFTADSEIEVQVLMAFHVRVARHIGVIAAWHVDHKLQDTTELVGKKARRAAELARKENLKVIMIGLEEVGLARAGREENAAAVAADALTGHRLRVASCMPPARGAVMLCTVCGGYSSKRMVLLGRPCRGPHGRSQAAGARIAAFGSGRHPFEREVRLGDHWPPPVAVAGWLLGRWGVGGAAGGGRAVPSSSAGPAGSSLYRAGVLAASGLSEAMLAVLVEEAKERRREPQQF